MKTARYFVSNISFLCIKVIGSVTSVTELATIVKGIAQEAVTYVFPNDHCVTIYFQQPKTKLCNQIDKLSFHIHAHLPGKEFL